MCIEWAPDRMSPPCPARDPDLHHAGILGSTKRKLFSIRCGTFVPQRVLSPNPCARPGCARGRCCYVTTTTERRRMDDLCRYPGRPFAFIFRYVRRRAFSHSVIAAAGLAAGGCFITTQYGVKYLVDTLSGHGTHVWFAFGLLVSLIAADNLLWRIAGFVMSSAFVRVTGDLRRGLVRRVTGGSP